MTCLEAQSNIMAFIDKKLPENRVSDFVRHIKYCPNCAEELEIYYTLIVGMRQVDNNEEMSRDFKKDMKQELDRLENKVKHAKRFKVSTIGIIATVIVIIGILIYEFLLSRFYNVEQRILKENQGSYFYAETFGDYLDADNEDIVEIHRLEHEEFLKRNDKNIYELIREYNVAHIMDEEGQEGLNE